MTLMILSGHLYDLYTQQMMKVVVQVVQLYQHLTWHDSVKLNTKMHEVLLACQKPCLFVDSLLLVS